MGAMTSQITSLTIVYSTVYSGAHQRKHQSSASVAFVIGELPAQMAGNVENVSVWWRRHALQMTSTICHEKAKEDTCSGELYHREHLHKSS